MDKKLILLILTLFCARLLPAQQPEVVGENLLRLEGTDPDSGNHYLRLILLLKDPNSLNVPADKATPEMLPRFTMECREKDGKHSLFWFLRFDGSPDFAYTPVYKPQPGVPYFLRNPDIDVKMRFEGYQNSGWFKTQWEKLPSGELRYRNYGFTTSNLQNPVYYLTWLKSLPNLHFMLAKPTQSLPKDLVFPTKPLLDLMKQSPICQP
jgi:hypothetical protein